MKQLLKIVGLILCLLVAAGFKYFTSGFDPGRDMTPSYWVQPNIDAG